MCMAVSVLMYMTLSVLMFMCQHAAAYARAGTLSTKHPRYAQADTLRNQLQETTNSAKFVPGMRFLVFYFGV
eukprot:2445881-Rhodomonas_salina.1